jgi:hypothetical protein
MPGAWPLLADTLLLLGKMRRGAMAAFSAIACLHAAAFAMAAALVFCSRKIVIPSAEIIL